jgi:hypothetical protein
MFKMFIQCTGIIKIEFVGCGSGSLEQWQVGKEVIYRLGVVHGINFLSADPCLRQGTQWRSLKRRFKTAFPPRLGGPAKRDPRLMFSPQI